MTRTVFRGFVMAGAALAILAGAFPAIGASALTVPATGRIVFFDIFQHHYGIYTMAGDGSDRQAITPTNRYAYGPAWSADGTRIAYVEYRKASDSYQIKTVDPDGSDAVVVRKGVGSGSEVPAGTLSWSPDATQLVFDLYNLKSGDERIMLMDIDGTHLHQIDVPGESSNPQWSPDGTRLAYATTAGRGSLAIATMDPDGTNRTFVAVKGFNFGPAWSPDGTSIVFVKYQHPENTTDLYLVGADGAGLTMVTDTPRRHENTPSFSPDGTRLLFGKSDAADFGSDWDVWTSALDGTHRVRLTNTSPHFDEFSMSWQPS